VISNLIEKVIRVLFVTLVAWLFQSCFLDSFIAIKLNCNQGKRHQLCGGPCGEVCSRLIEKRKLTRSEGPFERGKGLKKTQPLWPPQRGVGLREPNLGKTNPCVSLPYLLAICFPPPLADSIIFLTLTQLVVVFIFVNFSFTLFTPPLGDYQTQSLNSTFVHRAVTS
jgi:hypothetical protein